MRKLAYAAACAAALAGALPCRAAPMTIEAPGPPDSAGIAIGHAAIHPDYTLGEEMVVENWVLCTTRPNAEALLQAHDKSRAAAARITADLLASQVCGRFGKLRVILRERLGSAGVAAGDTRAFAAEVGLADTWAPGFLITGTVDEITGAR